jgi:hypothetical protein
VRERGGIRHRPRLWLWEELLVPRDVEYADSDSDARSDADADADRVVDEVRGRECLVLVCRYEVRALWPQYDSQQRDQNVHQWCELQ